MTQHVSDRERDSSILNHIHEGMAVYDRQGEKVGEVQSVYLGGSSEPGRRGARVDSGDLLIAVPTPPSVDQSGSVATTAHAFDDEDDHPRR